MTTAYFGEMEGNDQSEIASDGGRNRSVVAVIVPTERRRNLIELPIKLLRRSDGTKASVLLFAPILVAGHRIVRCCSRRPSSVRRRRNGLLLGAVVDSAVRTVRSCRSTTNNFSAKSGKKEGKPQAGRFGISELPDDHNPNFIFISSKIRIINEHGSRRRYNNRYGDDDDGTDRNRNAAAGCNRNRNAAAGRGSIGIGIDIGIVAGFETDQTSRQTGPQIKNNGAPAAAGHPVADFAPDAAVTDPV
jgi:hypothetical protein